MTHLTDEKAVANAYTNLSRDFGLQVLVQAMLPTGVELILGLVHDAQFGPLLLLGAGGILAEVLQDRCLLALPTDAETIKAALFNLRLAPLLHGVRGRPAVDIDAIVQAALGLAAFATDTGDLIAEVDLNPLIALPNGAFMVDALIIPKRGDKETER